MRPDLSFKEGTKRPTRAIGIVHTAYPAAPHVALGPLLCAKWLLFAVAIAATSAAFIELTHFLKKRGEAWLPHLGLRMALSSHAKAGSLIVMDSLEVKDGKTKVLSADLAKLGFGKTALVIDGDAVENSFALAAGNLAHVNVLPAAGANVYDILKHDTLVLTRAAVEKLEARFNG